ncbi:glutamate receptor ionotropic, NMDA 3A-like [Scylla paramamosain]|uniref:glutamate receptor ionotropic, NMDA 3A-like n=1 Tax=Scylla paramamosain TaxID=85552 RepID=UPI00308281A6
MVGHVWLLALLAPYVTVAGTFLMPQKQEKLLRVLSEVASGPARGQLVILHLDAAIPVDLFEAAVRSLRPTLHSTLTFGNDHSWPPPDLKWGVIENGSWVGVLGMIARGEKNFTINSFSLTDDRTQVFDASTCIQIDPYSAFLPSPQQLPKWLSIFRPFTTTVLASLVLTTVMCSILLLLKERLRKRLGVPQPSQGSATSFWLVLQGSLVGQSVPGLPKALWQRTFVAVWLISCLVVTAAYSSNLVGILTSPAYYRHLHTLQELVESDYRLALVDNGSYIAAHIKNNNESSLQSFQQRMDVFPTYKEAIAALEKGSHIMLQIRGYLSLELHKYLEDEYWYMLQQNVASGQQVWYFAKHTPWKHKFDEVIRQLSWFGFIEHWREVEEEAWKKTIKPTRKGGKREDSSPAQSLTLSHLQGSFYILSIAWALSVLVFFLEISSHRYSVTCSTDMLVA